MLRKLQEANHLLGKLDSLTEFVDVAPVFQYSYIRKEAVLSSRIEGTQSSLSELLLFELGEAHGVPTVDVHEVSNYIRALTHGMRRLSEDFPMCLRLIREMHRKLMSSGRGSTKQPGEFRTSQNWIGGSGPGTAVYVPPPLEALPDLLRDLERYVHLKDDHLPELVRIGLIHAQFETLHPFLDGNGRVGRLLISLLLSLTGLLKAQVLTLSLFLMEHRATYYNRLNRIRTHGDWESWIDFFLDGIIYSAQHSVRSIRRIHDQFETDLDSIRGLGRSAPSATLVHQTLQIRPMLNIAEMCNLSGLSVPTVNRVARVLEASGMLKEISGRQRRRVYLYEPYWRILVEGQEEDSGF